MTHTTTALSVASLLDGLRAVYQPVVDLLSGDVLGFEALARGRAGTAWESPLELFARGRALGIEEEVDWQCRAAAFEGALTARLPSSSTLFVNVEPRFLAAPMPERLRRLLEQTHGRLQVVVEITERALVADPAGLLAGVRRIRQAGWGVALDDVGQQPASLALMPFLEPDVIKLDLRLVQDNTAADTAMIVNAVAAQAERSGAVVLAEGIETPVHRRRALAMGATVGQGWLLGRPAPLPDRPAAPLAALPAGRRARPPGGTPCEILLAARPAREATKQLLLPISHYLERHALSAAEPPLLLACFEQARHFTAGTAERYRRLASHCSLVAALGAGMVDWPVPGVRGADLLPDDPLRGEWTVVVVGPHFAGALAAQDLGDGESVADPERRFRFVLTYHRELVLEAARSLLSRIAPDLTS